MTPTAAVNMHFKAKKKKTLFAHISPHALHKVLGPAGPRRIAGVLFSLTPQC